LIKDNQTFLPYGKQLIDQDDIDAVTNVLKSDYLTEGPLIDQFEKTFAKSVGSKYAIVCSSGTAGLHLASVCLNIDSQSTVLVPAISFVATANAPMYTGANIEFVDVDPRTGLISAKTLSEAIINSSNEVKVLFYVHLNGIVQDLSEISNICKNHNIMIIEDSCHAIGGSMAAHKIGSCYNSEMSVFSFHPVKTITMGEGGVVTTNSKKYKKKLKLFRSHGIVKNESNFINKNYTNEEMYGSWSYEMQHLGFNYRASALNVALGLSQLKKLNSFIKRRLEIALIYDKLFLEMSSKFEPISRDVLNSHGYHLYPILIKGENPLARKRIIIEFLKMNNIGSQVHYIPIPFQPFWENKTNFKKYVGAFEYFSRCLSIPIFPAMNNKDVYHVVNCIKLAFEEAK
jgi:UDP-4-amino-4,6-dideoxy-N-acetyl-beta-L-altrosamine transaminase